MSFRDYIAERRITDTPAGDFVADAKRDPGLPDAETWDTSRRISWPEMPHRKPSKLAVAYGATIRPL